MSCPNINSPEWKELTNQVDLETAYRLWRIYEGEVPKAAVDQALGKVNTTPFKKAEEQLANTLRQILAKMGVSYEAVPYITDKEGRVISNAVGKADMLNKVMQVVEGKASPDTLPEEAAHFFIEMLDKESHVYKGMYDKIVSFPVYQEVRDTYSEQYNFNEEAIRKEAMGKLVAQEIMKLHDSDLSARDQQVVNNWWNMLLTKLKQLFTRFDKAAFNEALNDIAPFRNFAASLLDNNVSELSIDRIDTTQEFFQLVEPVALTEDQRKIIDVIKKGAEGITTERSNEFRGYKKDGVKLGESVTTRRDKLFDKKLRLSTKEDPMFQAKKLIAGKVGSEVHDDIQNIFLTQVIKDESVQKVIKSNPNVYAKLEIYVKGLVASYPKGTVFLVEQIVYDPTLNMPGTIDLLAITPSGVVDMYDWKTMNISKKEKEQFGEPSNVKTAKYEWQLNKYKQVLNTYGIKKFGKIRYVPIETQFTYDKKSNKFTFKGIDIGKADPEKNKDKVYLNPIPVSEEVTGIEQVDKLITQLKSLVKDIETKRTLTPIEREKKSMRINLLKRSIRELQLRRHLGTFQASSDIEFKIMKSRLADKTTPISEQEVADILDHLKVFTDLTSRFAHLYRKDSEVKLDTKAQQALHKIETEAAIIKDQALEKMKEIIVTAANEAGVTKEQLDAPQKPIGYMTKMTTAISRIDHPIFRTMWNLINKSKNKVMQESNTLNKDIAEKLTALKEEAKGKGLSGTAIFDIMLDKNNGSLISKFSKDYYKIRDKKIEEGDVQWIKQNSIVDEEGIKKYLEDQRKFIKSYTFSNDKTMDARIKKEKLEDLETYANLLTSDKAFLNTDSFVSRFVKPSEAWLSKEYKALKSNKAAFDFYNLFVKKMKEFNQFMPFGQGERWVNPENFLPNVRQDLIEQVMNAGGSSAVKGMGSNFSDMFDYALNKEAMFGEINEFTGEYQRRVPAYFLKNLPEGQAKSFDLGMVLGLFGRMAYNYKYMSEVEGTVRNLRNALEDSKEITVDGTGKALRSVFNDKIMSKVISADTLGLFNDFVNYYVYGVQQKDDYGSFTKKKKIKNPETGEVEVVDTEISYNKIAGTALQTFSAKAIGLNLITGVANLFSAVAMPFIAASGGNFFNKSQWLKAQKLAVKGSLDPKVMAILEALDYRGTRGLSDRINSLSVNDLAREVSVDKLFVLLQKADDLVFKTTALSLMQNFGLDKDGKITRLDRLEKGSKSLLDLVELDDTGKINLAKIVNENELLKFKGKINALVEKMVGMSTRDNVSAWRLTMTGQALMQFRGWIPRTVGARFGGSKYDAELETIERGRYLSFINQLWSKQFVSRFGDLVSAVVIGKASKNTKELSRNLYIKFITENPELADTVTEEMFYETHIANLRATMTEMLIIAVITMLIMGLGDGWEPLDDDEKRMKRQTLKGLNRVADELTFYLLPTSFQSIIKGGIPAFGLLNDIERLLSQFFGEGKGILLGDEDLKKKNKPLWQTLRMMPGGNTVWNFFGPTD